MVYTKQKARELLSTVFSNPEKNINVDIKAPSNAKVTKKLTKTGVSIKVSNGTHKGTTVVDKPKVKKSNNTSKKSKDKLIAKEKKPKKDVPLCKGKTVKGTACSRKGSHNGYCYQHAEGAKKSEGSKGDTKLKKSTNANSKPGKDSYRYRIGRAIMADSDKKGSSRQAIKKYLGANYKVEEKDHFRVNSTLKKMVESGELIKNPKHLGHYRLSIEFKKLI